jgi:hypothetical protein
MNGMNQQQVNKIMSILLLIFCVIGAIWGIARQNSLKKNNKIGMGTVTSFRAGGRGNAGGIWIHYVFEFEGKKYKGSSRHHTYEISSSDLHNYVLNKNFPVVYNPSNPSISSLLITPKDFSRFGYSFPDSLTWILQFVKEK